MMTMKEQHTCMQIQMSFSAMMVSVDSSLLLPAHRKQAAAYAKHLN